MEVKKNGLLMRRIPELLLHLLDFSIKSNKWSEPIIELISDSCFIPIATNFGLHPDLSKKNCSFFSSIDMHA